MEGLNPGPPDFKPNALTTSATLPPGKKRAQGERDIIIGVVTIIVFPLILHSRSHLQFSEHVIEFSTLSSYSTLAEWALSLSNIGIKKAAVLPEPGKN